MNKSNQQLLKKIYQASLNWKNSFSDDLYQLTRHVNLIFQIIFFLIDLKNNIDFFH